MQVVYSGGSSTPSPSPRLQRKNYTGVGGYGRPVMPGYMMGGAHSPHPHLHPGMASRASREKVGAGDGERSLRDSIPAMSKPLAVTCLLLNIVLPGLDCQPTPQPRFKPAVITKKRERDYTPRTKETKKRVPSSAFPLSPQSPRQQRVRINNLQADCKSHHDVRCQQH